MNTFNIGDVVLFTERSKKGEELRTAVIVGTNKFGDTMIEGISGYGYLPTGSGAFRPEEVGTKPYGFYCKAEVIATGIKRSVSSFYPRPGDRGYDLMC